MCRNEASDQTTDWSRGKKGREMQNQNGKKMTPNGHCGYFSLPDFTVDLLVGFRFRSSSVSVSHSPLVLFQELGFPKAEENARKHTDYEEITMIQD